MSPASSWPMVPASAPMRRRSAIGCSSIPVSTCGVCERCTAGLEPYCENLRTIGSTRHGASPSSWRHRRHCATHPRGDVFVEAACLPVAYMTAWHALVTAGRVQPGETVLVNAAGAGVSTAIVQFAVAAGATVIGTAGGAEKVAGRSTSGVPTPSITTPSTGATSPERCSRFTDGRGVDLVVDHVGPALFEASIRSLAIEGRMVFCGTTTGTTVEVDLPSRLSLGQDADRCRWVPPDRVRRDAGGRRPPRPAPDRRLRPAVRRLTEAQQQMADGAFFGKIVVTFD